MPVMTKVCLTLLSVALVASAQDARRPSALLQEACTACHGLNRLETTKNRGEWQETVERMVNSGADVKPEEMKGLVGFLVRYYGDNININTATAQQLQDEMDMTPAEAEAIIKARSENGNFKSYADIQKIKGLDPKRFDPIKDRFKY
jgi:competence ComEA-like helix-hairpin-helix protein